MNGSATRSEMYARFAPRLHAYARRFVDASLADDIVQEVFLRVLKYKSGEVEKLPLQFLLAMTRNTALRVLVSRRRELGGGPIEIDDARATRTERRAENAALRPNLSTLLERLPARQRDAVELTAARGLTEHQAARAMNASRSAVSQRKQAGLDHLRRVTLGRLDPSIHEETASHARPGDHASSVRGRATQSEPPPRALAS